jgi:hypothetical protein
VRLGDLSSNQLNFGTIGSVILGNPFVYPPTASGGMAIDKIGKKERRDNEIVRICWL